MQTGPCWQPWGLHRAQAGQISQRACTVPGLQDQVRVRMQPEVLSVDGANGSRGFQALYKFGEPKPNSKCWSCHWSGREGRRQNVHLAELVARRAGSWLEERRR